MTTYQTRTPHSDAIKRLDCSECGTLTRLFGIEPEKPGYEVLSAITLKRQLLKSHN